jgi:hypothetical protein
MHWRITGIVSVAIVLSLFIWAAIGESAILPLLLAMPFVVIARIAWARIRETGTVLGEE